MRCEWCTTEVGRLPRRDSRIVFCNRACYSAWQAARHDAYKDDYRAFRVETWGIEQDNKPRPAETKKYARAFEVLARDKYLPREGFIDIFDATSMSNSFFVDFVATRNGRRALVDVTTSTSKYVPHKALMAKQLGLPLFVMHVSPRLEGRYVLHEITGDRISSRISSDEMAAIRISLATQAGRAAA